jgi:hypothetical protein
MLIAGIISIFISLAVSSNAIWGILGIIQKLTPEGIQWGK